LKFYFEIILFAQIKLDVDRSITHHIHLGWKNTFGIVFFPMYFKPTPQYNFKLYNVQFGNIKVRF